MILKITKYDPSVNSVPKIISVNIDWKENMTVLEAIQFAHEKTPIAFDYNCRGRQCGRCAIMFDGKPVMACCTFIKADGTHTVEPLKGHPVLRDLIVYKRDAHDELSTIYNRIKDPAVGDLTDMQVLNDNYNTTAIEEIDAIEWCSRCLSCTAGCPAYNNNPSTYIGPAAMLAIAYRYYDPYDAGDRVRQAYNGGLWNCIMCGQCDYICPQLEIKRVPKIWKDLRKAATDAGLGEKH